MNFRASAMSPEIISPKPPSPLAHDIFLRKKSLEQMDKAIKRLSKIVKKGGWPTLKPRGIRLKVGDKNEEVTKVKRQLMTRGDLHKSGLGLRNHFNDSLEDAILNFQKRHGIRQSGYVDRRTRLALAISAKQRLKQLKVNKRRLKKAIAKNKEKKYVVVNVPDYTLQAVNNGKIDLSSRVVVGRFDRQTPDLSVKIEGVNFNPFWHVPQKLVREDLIPQQIKNPKFIEDQKLKVFKEWGGPRINPKSINWRSAAARSYKFRQDPGDQNALGRIRIHMPNRDVVYLHDTPTKKLFALRARAHSAGCVRVEKIKDLAKWILQDHKKWPKSKITETLKGTKHINAMIKNHIPVHFIYVTSWVDSKNQLHFREDIYKRDKGITRIARRKTKKKKEKPSLSP